MLAKIQNGTFVYHKFKLSTASHCLPRCLHHIAYGCLHHVTITFQNNKSKLSLEGRSFPPPLSLLTSHRLGVFTSRDNSKLKLG